MFEQRLGLSTGTLFKVMPDSSLATRLSVLSGIPFLQRPALPMELHIAQPEQLEEALMPSLRFYLLWLSGRIFPHRISIHAPIMPYPSAQSDFVVPRLKELAFLAQSESIVFHPDMVEPHWLAENFGGLACVENMDISKPTGRTPQELQDFNRPGIRFVLDTNHAVTMEQNGADANTLTRDLIAFMGDRLSHVHISGVTPSDPHCMYQTDGTEVQAGILKQVPKGVTLIHEGVIPLGGNIQNVLMREQELIGNGLPL